MNCCYYCGIETDLVAKIYVKNYRNVWKSVNRMLTPKIPMCKACILERIEILCNFRIERKD